MDELLIHPFFFFGPDFNMTPTQSERQNNLKLPKNSAEKTPWLNHFFSLPSSRFQLIHPLAGMRFGWVLILGCVRIRIRPLIQVAQRVVYLPMLGFVGPDI